MCNEIGANNPSESRYVERPFHLPPTDKRWGAFMTLRATINDNALYSRWDTETVLRACYDVISGISKNGNQFMFCDSLIDDDLIANIYDRVHDIGRANARSYIHLECYARTLAIVSMAFEDSCEPEWQAFDRDIFVKTEWPTFEH